MRPPFLPSVRRSRPPRRARIGRQGERAAARWLRRRGYRILARRWRTPYGEVDLLIDRGPVLLLVEVKSTAVPGARAPLHRLGAAQRGRLQRARRWTAKRRGRNVRQVRLAVVGVALHPPTPVCVLRIVVHGARKRR